MQERGRFQICSTKLCYISVAWRNESGMRMMGRPLRPSVSGGCAAALLWRWRIAYYFRLAAKEFHKEPAIQGRTFMYLRRKGASIWKSAKSPSFPAWGRRVPCRSHTSSGGSGAPRLPGGTSCQGPVRWVVYWALPRVSSQAAMASSRLSVGANSGA